MNEGRAPWQSMPARESERTLRLENFSRQLTNGVRLLGDGQK